MLSIFRKDPAKKLTKLYNEKLEQAMKAQRNGAIQSYAILTSEAEEIAKKLEQLKKT